MKKAILIYDDHCPLCVCYTRLFVRTGLIAPGERKAFSEISDELLTRIDFARGSNEIPLVNMETGEVHYGIDALLEVLGRKMPWIKKTGNWPGVNGFLRKLYKLVSFNRKVIVATTCGKGEIDCSPAFNIPYRMAFLVLGLIFNTFMLIPVQGLLQTFPSYSLSLSGLQLVHFSILAVNLGLALCFKKEQAFEFLGQVNMLALMVNLLLVPLILLNGFLTPLWLGICLAGIMILIFREYVRRMTYARVLQTHSWVAGLQLGGMALLVSFAL